MSVAFDAIYNALLHGNTLSGVFASSTLGGKRNGFGTS
jgi:hypothetical protein